MSGQVAVRVAATDRLTGHQPSVLRDCPRRELSPSLLARSERSAQVRWTTIRLGTSDMTVLVDTKRSAGMA